MLTLKIIACLIFFVGFQSHHTVNGAKKKKTFEDKHIMDPARYAQINNNPDQMRREMEDNRGIPIGRGRPRNNFITNSDLQGVKNNLHQGRVDFRTRPHGNNELVLQTRHRVNQAVVGPDYNTRNIGNRRFAAVVPVAPNGALGPPIHYQSRYNRHVSSDVTTGAATPNRAANRRYSISSYPQDTRKNGRNLFSGFRRNSIP